MLLAAVVDHGYMFAVGRSSVCTLYILGSVSYGRQGGV